MSLKLAADLFSKPPKVGEDGLISDYRTVEMATTDLVTTQIYAVGVIPAGHRVHQFAVECDDLDTGTAMVFSVGVLNALYDGRKSTDGLDADSPEVLITSASYTAALVSGMNLLTASTLGQTGGRADAALGIANAIGAVDYDRIIAVEINTAPGTAAAGTFSTITGYARD
jgi:hypothetical protein